MDGLRVVLADSLKAWGLGFVKGILTLLGVILIVVSYICTFCCCVDCAFATSYYLLGFWFCGIYLTTKWVWRFRSKVGITNLLFFQYLYYSINTSTSLPNPTKTHKSQKWQPIPKTNGAINHQWYSLHLVIPNTYIIIHTNPPPPRLSTRLFQNTKNT